MWTTPYYHNTRVTSTGPPNDTQFVRFNTPQRRERERSRRLVTFPQACSHSMLICVDGDSSLRQCLEEFFTTPCSRATCHCTPAATRMACLCILPAPSQDSNYFFCTLHRSARRPKFRPLFAHSSDETLAGYCRKTTGRCLLSPEI